MVQMKAPVELASRSEMRFRVVSAGVTLASGRIVASADREAASDVFEPTRPRSALRNLIRRRRFVTATLVVVAALPLPRLLHAQKTDVIVMENGDAVTGEIKGLERGKLDYKTDDIGRLSVKWTKVLRVTSRHYFEVETSVGRKYFGQLLASEQDSRVIVGLDGRRDTLDLQRIVRMYPIEADFLSRVRAFLDVGFSLAKANRNLTINANTEADYRGQRWGAGVSYTGYVQRQRDTSVTTSNTVRLTGTRYLTHRWDVNLLVQFEQNDELNLVSRYTGGATGARRFLQTNSHEIRGAAGAVVTTERFASTDTAALNPDTAKANIEGLLAFEWAWFRFDSPKLDIGTTIITYPSITQVGRLRGDARARVKYEIFADFHVGLNVSLTFDTQPPDQTAANTDYQTSITIGWSYRR
jgi:hypothetical protein